MIFINGKKVNKDKALEFIDNAKKINRVEMSYLNEEKENSVPTMEGFDISKDLLVKMVRSMDKCNADFIRATFTNCGKLKNKNLEIIIRNGKPGFLERVLRKFNFIP